MTIESGFHMIMDFAIKIPEMRTSAFAKRAPRLTGHEVGLTRRGGAKCLL